MLDATYAVAEVVLAFLTVRRRRADAETPWKVAKAECDHLVVSQRLSTWTRHHTSQA